MRTAATPQSALRAPLNAVLGTEASVRLLRALVLAGVSMTAGELARRTSLNRTGVYPALRALEAAGAVEFVGAGPQRQVQLRSAHPLSSSIASLFHAEALHVDSLIAALRAAAAELKPPPTSVWIEGAAAEGTDRLGDPLLVYVMADPARLPAVVDALSERIGAIEQRYDVRVDIQSTTRSELRARSASDAAHLEHAILLLGVPQVGLRTTPARLRPAGVQSHADHDARARRLAAAIAARLREDPGLTLLARRRIAERSQVASPSEQRELREWERILAMPVERLRRFLVDPTERAARLRQTLPLFDVLTQSERDAAIGSITDADATAAVSRRRHGSRAT